MHNALTMDTRLSLRVPKSLSDSLEGPVPKAKLAKIAILMARQRPDVLGMALRAHSNTIANPKKEEETRITIKGDPETLKALRELAEHNKIPMDIVLSRALEAYLKKY